MLLRWCLIVGQMFSVVIVLLVMFAVCSRGSVSQVETALLPELPDVDLAQFAREWEPDLYEELGTGGAPPKFSSAYKSPCFHSADGALRCVPGAYVLGGWQCGVRSLGQLCALRAVIRTQGFARGVAGRGVGSDRRRPPCLVRLPCAGSRRTRRSSR